MKEENKELLVLFESLRVADVRDGMDYMGYHHYGSMDYRIRPLERCKAVGIARTARYVPLVLSVDDFKEEIKRVIILCETYISNGHTCVVYTRRERLDINNGNKEEELILAVKISDAITKIVGELKVTPSFLIAKGGITSSEIGTKALKVKKALVLGQILPGVPVWKIGKESKFPGMSYVIFPGNVGSDRALLEAVEKMSYMDETNTLRN